MHLIFAYIKFLFRSTNQHGVHSPFVYNLVTKCFYDRKKYSSYKTISEYRKKILNSEKVIKVSDFGAGSKVFSSDERKVSALAKNVGISPKRAELLNRLVRYLNIDSALELGTSLGMGTAAMAAGNSVKITTLEGCPATAAVAEGMFEEFDLKNVDLRVGDFDAFLVDGGQRSDVSGQWSLVSGQWSWKKGNTKFQIPNSRDATHDPILNTQYSILNTHYSLLYIDGNHTKEATLRYFQKLLPYTHNDSVMIFDDIHWSAEMEEAWEEIKKHPAVTVTIDTFFWGFVFFRKEQEKQDFVIRV